MFLKRSKYDTIRNVKALEGGDLFVHFLHIVWLGVINKCHCRCLCVCFSRFYFFSRPSLSKKILEIEGGRESNDDDMLRIII